MSVIHRVDGAGEGSCVFAAGDPRNETGPFASVTAKAFKKAFA